MSFNNPVVLILDSDGNEVLSTIVNIGASVIESKTFSKHSLENSQVVVDDQYDNPTLVTLRVILNPSDYLDVYKEIKSLYQSITNFTVQTKVDSYSNLYLEAIPHEEDPAMFNTIQMNLEFTEQLVVSTNVEGLETSDVSNPGDSDTVNSGSKVAEQDDGTVLQRAASFIGDLF